MHRNHLWGIIAAIAILRRCQHWLKYLLQLLRLRQNAESEDAWDEVSFQRESDIRLAQIGNTAPVGNARYVSVWISELLFVCSLMKQVCENFGCWFSLKDLASCYVLCCCVWWDLAAVEAFLCYM